MAPIKRLLSTKNTTPSSYTNYLSHSKYTGLIKPNHLFTTAGNYISIERLGIIEQVAEAIEAQFHSWSKPNNTLKRLCAII
jgi:hypothetical protein